jgi:hypothetical protein
MQQKTKTVALLQVSLQPCMAIPSIPFGGYTSLLLGVDQDVEPAVRKLHFDGVPDDEITF